MESSHSDNLKKHETEWERLLQEVEGGLESSNSRFNQSEHDSKSRLEITKLFLKSYFFLIAGAFLFSAVYNFIAIRMNIGLIKKAHEIGLSSPPEVISYLDVSNTVSIITTTLSSGVGFVIGYYFKNKGDA